MTQPQKKKVFVENGAFARKNMPTVSESPLTAYDHKPGREDEVVCDREFVSIHDTFDSTLSVIGYLVQNVNNLNTIVRICDGFDYPPVAEMDFSEYNNVAALANAYREQLGYINDYLNHMTERLMRFTGS